MKKLAYSKVAILGMGISGKAVSSFLKKKGISHFGIDKEAFLFSDIEVRSEKEKPTLCGIDLVIKSPGIRNEHPWVKEALAKGLPVIGEIDLALSEINCKKVYGITGSNGKTTTTLFLVHLLNCMGKKAAAAGNVGIPLISQVDLDHEELVLELSSFQLENIVPGHILDAAVILNISPNHLDRHASFKEYAQAKLNIRSILKADGRFFVSKKVSEDFHLEADIFDSTQENVETFFSLRYRDGKIKYFPHDVQNFSAAYAVAMPSFEQFKRAVETFQKPPHRIEFVREWKGVSFFNDSKATSVDAVQKAVFCMSSTVILLAGGVDKGGSFKDWIPFFEGKVKQIFAFGKAAARMHDELSSYFAVEIVETLEEGTKKAAHIARPGDVVLLSPGCSSYDQFKDYQHRGEHFKEIVHTLGYTQTI